ncbi:MAG: DUF4347 domain-containing protein [Roseiarcus sp.]|jgi:hypothetical protein
MVIDCIDMTDSALGASRIAALNAACVASTQLQFYGMSNGVTQMVSAVVNAASAGAVDALRIWGHGGPGSQNVSSGASGDSTDQDFAGVSVTNFGQTAGVLQQLTPLFSASGRAELRGCSVGADGAGRALLLDLASLWNINVYGGDVIQIGGDWSPPVTCAAPSGALSTTSGPALVDGNT